MRYEILERNAGIDAQDYWKYAVLDNSNCGKAVCYCADKTEAEKIMTALNMRYH
jgi:hypothetical protein